MASFMTIVNRLPMGEAAVQYALDSAQRLRADGVSCVVARRQELPRDVPPMPLMCHSPETGPPMEYFTETDELDGRFTDAELDGFLQKCRTLADVANVSIEALQHRATIPEVINAAGCLANLICLSRESLFEKGSPRHQISRVLSWTPRPLLICPAEYRPWSRIIVAASSQNDLPMLSRWGGHWSRCWNLPCEVIAPSRSHKTNATLSVRCRAWCEEWLPGLLASQAQWNKIVREWNLNGSDLLLVGREATLWPLPFGDGWRLPSLVRYFPGTLGILPSLFVGGVAELLGISAERRLLSDDSLRREQVA